MTVQQLNSFRTGPDERGHFGIYGGRFVAETLMPLVLELEKAYAAARSDPDRDVLPILADTHVGLRELALFGPRDSRIDLVPV